MHICRVLKASLEEGPQLGGQEGAQPLCAWGACAHAKLHSETAGSFPIFDRDSIEKAANREHRRVGRSTSISALVAVSRFLSCIFLKPVLCFRGARQCVPVFNAGSGLGNFQARFLVFLVSGPDLGGTGAPLCSFFAPRIDKFTHLC